MAMNHGNLLQNQTKLMAIMQFILQKKLRVFRRKDLQTQLPAELQTLSYQTISDLLYKLSQSGWLIPIRKGSYEVAQLVNPLHEYEIAMILADPVMLSHRSAFRYHHLTDQILNTVYLTTLKTVFVPQQKSVGKNNKKTYLVIKGVEYNFICIAKKKFFGDEIAWIGDSKFKVSNLERTLLDGLSHPQYCGGFQEVIYAFQEGFARLDLEQIISYGMRLDTAVSRRLGWILDNILKVSLDKINCLKKPEYSGYRLLDASSAARGKYDLKWQIRLNHHY